MKKSRFKGLTKFLSVVLCLCVLLSCVPITGFAAGQSVPCEVDGCDGVYENGFCTVCEGFESAVLNNNGTEGDTSDDYYEIGNAGQLYWFAGLVNGTLSGVNENTEANAKLTANITVNPGKFDANGNYTPKGGETVRVWTPIGKSAYDGTFDGKKSDTENYTISGLYFNDGNTDCVGLFGCVDDGKILNTNVSDSYFNGKTYVGGIVGDNYGTVDSCTSFATVVGERHVGGVAGTNGAVQSVDGGQTTFRVGSLKNCVNSGNVTGGMYVGGVAGYNNNELINSKNSGGTVTGSKNNIGGVTGYNSDGTVDGCTNTGTVIGTGTEGYGNSVGGVAGYNKGYVKGSLNSGSISAYESVGGVAGKNFANYTVENCENSGTVTASYDYTGGIVGENNGTVKTSKNTDKGTVTGAYYTGGVAGYISSTGALEDCSNEASVSGSNYVGGVAGRSSVIVKNCRNKGSITGTESVGGVVGGAYGPITDCRNEGTVSADSYYVGGIAGSVYDGNSITYCYNTGDITSKSNNVGGVAGYADGDVSNCYNTGNVSGESNFVGGIAGSAQKNVSKCYTTGTVTGKGYFCGAVVGYNNDTVSDCYYIKGSATNGTTTQNGIGAVNVGMAVEDEEGVTTAKTAGDFKSGEVAYLLNGEKSTEDVIWKQTLTGEKPDESPNFTGGIVYKKTNTGCSGAVAAYSNAEGDTYKGTHPSYENGFCTVCGGCEEPELKNGYYEIGNAGELYWFAALVNGELEGVTQNKKANAKLTANITVNPGKFDENGNYTAKNGETVREWTPIGKSSAVYYNGTFDGCGYTISGLYFNDESATDVGLVGDLYGTVQNVGVISSYIKCEGFVGGVVGWNESGTLKNCYNSSTVVGTKQYAGGVAGYNYQSGKIENCYNTGTVSGGSWVGGVVACNRNIVTYCYNTGTVNGSNSAVGGVAGDNEKTISYCYNTGSVKGSVNYVGAVCGVSSGTITGCFYLENCAKGKKDVVQNGVGTSTMGGSAADTAGATTVKTADEFKTGAVAYALNGNKGGGTFKQTLSGEKADAEPNFTGKSVYYGYTSCEEDSKPGYTNNSAVSEERPLHNYINGICSRTEGETHLEPATLNNNGTEEDASDDYYEIANLGNLLWFANKVNGGETGINAKLTENIDATSVTYIGIGKNASVAYSGTFDGNFKTLKIKLVSKEQYTAPFPYISGATVKNLTVEGDITTTHKFAAGIVGRVEGGNATLENCLSLVNIDSTNYTDGNKNDGTHGGLIAVADSATTLNNCGFAGSMVGATTKYCGGIVGWAGAKVSISNSFVAATINLNSAESGDTFSRNQGNVTLTNCYYLTKFSDEIMLGATQMSAEKFANGEVAYLLNGSKSTEDTPWKQTLTGETPDKFPVLTGGTVYKMKNEGCTAADDRYSNTEDESFEAEHPSLENGICSVCGGYEKAPKVNGVYEIGNLGQLMWFASKVNSQEITSHTAKLTEDITIDNTVVWTPIVLKDNCASSFDGCNHTITFANTNEGSTFGLFGGYNYSTIKNLYLAGSITCNQSNLLGALVNSGYRTTITNVISTVNIENSGNASTGGLIGRLGGKTTQAMIKNSAVYADVKSAGRAGGLIGENWGGTQHCYVQNCAYMGDVTGSVQGAIMGYNGLQSKCVSHFAHVYYCEKDGLSYCGGTYGGTISLTSVESKTADDFEKGAVAYALNENKTEGVWKQTIGTDKYPNFTGASVYRGYAQCDDTLRYSNAPLHENAHWFDNEGFCHETEGETHYEPAALKNGVYEISNAGQLYWFAKFVNEGNKDVNAVLTADIDLKGRAWTPIGQYSDSKPDSDNNLNYGGIFDGQKHTISNLKVTVESTYETGLFSRTYGATLKNFGVINATVENTQGIRAGVIAGELHNSTVENVFTAGTITVTTTNNQGQAGGIAGEAAGSTLKGCFTTYNMLVSSNTTSAPVITNCYYKADSANGSSLGEFKSATAFENGEVTYLLNGETSEGELVWKQTLKEGSLPGFTGETVYCGYLSCADDAKKVYTNDSTAKAEKPSHKYENGICCETAGEIHYEPATLKDGVYEIGNAGQLYWFAGLVNGTLSGVEQNTEANARLTANITVNKDVLKDDGTLNEAKKDSFRVWTPVGNYSNKYSGTFDGKKNDTENYTVSGLYFNDENTDYVGLFGVSSGTIKNVGVSGSYFKGKTSVGGVVGNSRGTVTNCCNAGTVSGVNGVGGVVGYNYSNGAVTNCYNEGNVSSSSNNVGGVVGANDGYGSSATVTNCYNTGNVSGEYQVGGVVGHNYYGTVTNCYNTGNVSGTYYIGGVAGVNNMSAVANCYNTGSVSGEYQVGSIVGLKNYGTATNCYYLKGVATDNDGTAQNGIGTGTVGKTAADVEGSTTVKTADEFASGEVAFLLNGSESTEDVVWKQTLTGDSPDKLPSFTGKTVYKFTNCLNKVYYLNEYVAVTHDFDDNGFCKLCDAYEPAKLTDGVYEIGNAGQLYWFASKVNGGDREINGKLTADITVNKDVLNEDGTLNEAKKDSFRVWTPIGDSFTNRYRGTFDGKKNDTENYTVSGLYFNDEQVEYVGLFGVSSGTIKNVGVVGSYFTTKGYVGGVVGYNYSGTVTNCYNTGTVSGDAIAIGGVVGDNYNGNVMNCRNTGTVSGTNQSIGGVVGVNNGGNVTNCRNTGDVNGICYVGGVVGYNYSGTVTNCYNAGTVTATEQFVGGIAGKNRGTMTNCYNTGKVGGTKQVIGGVVGQNNNGTMENCYYLNTCGAGGEGTSKTADEFASGEVAFLLNGSTSEETEEAPLVWKQTLTGDSPDKLPSFTGKTVYRYKNCAEGYSYANTQKEDGTHGEYKNGFCPCGETYESATLNDNGTPNDTSDDYYEIANAGQLYWFAAKVNGGYNRINGKLVANVTVNEDVLNENGTLNGDGSDFRVWTPIGNSNRYYRGTFDGKKNDTENYTISGLYFNDENTDRVGLFGYSEGTVKNINVSNSYIKGKQYVGGVVGYNNDGGTVTNCHGIGNSINGAGNYVGGVVGNSDGAVTNCFNTGNVSSTALYVGGVVGYNYRGNVTGCRNTGDVSGTDYYVGGVVGCNSSGAVTNCYNTGNVSSTAWYVGGIVGCNRDTVTNCYNTGNVSGTANYVGGIVGDNSDTVTNCYNTGNISSTARYVGGVVGRSNSGAVTNCYNTGNVGGKSTYIGSVVGKNNNGTVTNCYYLKDSATDANGNTKNGIGDISDLADVEGVTTVKTADEFASGEVAYLLQAGVSPVTTTDDDGNEVTTTPLVWGQESSEDGATPILTDKEEYRVIPVKSGDDVVNYSVLHKGDTNNDGEVTIADYQKLVNIALSESNTKTAATKYDLNGDGVFDVLDCALAERSGMAKADYDILVSKALSSEPVYNARADFDSDGVVDVLDCAAAERLLSGHRVRIAA